MPKTVNRLENKNDLSHLKIYIQPSKLQPSVQFPYFYYKCSLVSDITCSKLTDTAITLPLGTYVMYCFVHVTMLVALLAAHTRHVKDQEYFIT